MGQVYKPKPGVGVLKAGEDGSAMAVDVDYVLGEESLAAAVTEKPNGDQGA